jgi:NADH:ubiquinone oxidoreductase subunit K
MTLKIPAKLWLAKVGIAKNILHMLFCILFMMNNFLMKCMTFGLKCHLTNDTAAFVGFSYHFT